MYTVKTIRIGSGDAPQVRINYQEGIQQTDHGALPADATTDANTNYAVGSDINKSFTMQNDQSIGSIKTDNGSYVSMLPNIPSAEKLAEIQGRVTTASGLAYDNAVFPLSSNSQHALADYDSNDDSNILAIGSNTQQNLSPNSTLQKLVILPKSEPSNCDNINSNTELQTTVDKIHSPAVYNEPEDSSIGCVHNSEPVISCIANTKSSSGEKLQQKNISDVALENFKRETDKQVDEVSTSEIKNELKQNQTPRLQKFTGSDLGTLGTSEKEISDYIECSKSRKGRPPSSRRRLDKDMRKADIQLTVGIEYDKCGAKINIKKENSVAKTDCKSVENVECKKVAGAFENQRHRQYSCPQPNVSKRSIKAKTVSKDKDEEIANTSRGQRARKVLRSEKLPNKKDKIQKKLYEKKETKRKEYPTRNKVLSQSENQSGPDLESRLDDPTLSRTFHGTKCVISLPCITMQSFRQGCTEYIVELEIDDDLDVSKLSKSDSSSGACKYYFSVTNPVPFPLKEDQKNDNSKKTGSKAESDVNVQVVKTETNVRKRKSRSKVGQSHGKKTKQALPKQYGDTAPKQLKYGDNKSVVNNDKNFRDDDNGDINDTNGSSDEFIEIADLETAHREAEKSVMNVETDGNSHLDPLTQLTTSLGLNTNNDLAQGTCLEDRLICEETLDTKIAIDTVNNRSGVTDQIDNPTAEDSVKMVADKKACSRKKKQERNYITRFGEDGVKVFCCPLCTHTSKYSQNILIHIAEHSDKKDFACEECGFQFKSKNRLSKHMIVHMTDRPFKCTLCPKAFKSKKIFCCNICPHVTRKSQNMDVHMNQHTSDRPYQCEVCGQTFNGPSNLHAHKSQHSDILKYTCVHCNKGFRDRATYIQHTRRHTGDKRHTCEHCGKSFVISTDLKKHIRIHTGEKPYKCSMCGKAFSDGSGMVRHQRIHTSKSRFECGACYKLFTRKDLCNYHIKKLHSDSGPVKVRELNLSEIGKSVNCDQSIKQAENDKIVSDQSVQMSPNKRTWQDFERLTEEATRRLQDSTGVQTYVSGPAGQIGEYQYQGLIPQQYHTMSSATRVYNTQANFYQQPNQELSLYTPEPIQNL